MSYLLTLKNALLHLVYPHVCAACGNDNLPVHSQLCIRCLHALPATTYEQHSDNPVERIFYGRVRVCAATALFYFTKASVMQQVMHQVKYRGNKALGLQLGKMMGTAILNSGRFKNIDILVPLPLFKKKEKMRGYNQAAILCDGIAVIMQVPVIKYAVGRTQDTASQTHKNRVARWQNMEGKFTVTNTQILVNKHVLLVDDVITTGATLEACATALLQIPGLRLSIATLCCSRNI